MSLFKTRDWWAVPVETDGYEECNVGHLIIGNVCNDDPPTNKIVIGSFSGILRIYLPQPYINEEEKETFGYRPDHLLLEVDLGSPILQLDLGKFVSGNSGLHLCVLHQDHLTVYTVGVIAGQTGYGSQTKLSKAYQHNFQRKAFGITSGSFGSVNGREFIAVQSLDGCISFYEQESLGFVCFLPGFLLPGPLAYLPQSDTLITQASDWTLQSYKYQTLSVLVQEHQKSLNNMKVGGKRIQPEWTQIMAEAALDFKVLSEPGNVSTLLILSTHSFYCYKDSGIVKFVKKLDYNPSCFTAFYHEKSITICVASHTCNILIYKETALKWASQVPFIPVAIERSDFKGIEGAIALLGDAGQTHVCYFGTDPSLFVAPPTETKDINYDQTDREMTKLNKIIRGSTKDTASLISLTKGDRELFVSASVSNQLEAWVGSTKVSDPDAVPCATAIICLTTQSLVQSVKINIHTHKPIGVAQDTFVMNTICNNCQILAKFYLAEQYVPCSLTATVITSYISVSGTPFVNKTEIYLPLKLVVKPSAPNKEADNKVTISTNKSAVNLPELFPEFELDSSASSALGFQYYGGANVTILSSRTTNRYRIQSDSMPALWIIFQTLKERLENFFAANTRGSEEKLVLDVTSPMPLQELSFEIDAHFLRRRKHKELENQLVQRSTQFRSVQRRLLTKFKDKTPTPLTNFDNLLEGTYHQILKITDAINKNINGLEEDSCQLSCVLKLLIEMLCLQTGLDAQQKELLSATLSPAVQQNLEQGWEEVVDSNVTFLLRSIFGKGTRDSVFSQTLSMPSDTNKLKKHIALLVDKIIKGGFTNQNELKVKMDQSKEVKFIEEKDMTNSEDTLARDQSFAFPEGAEVPLGSKLGEDRARSARIRSARHPSARKHPLLLHTEQRQASTEDDVHPSQQLLAVESPEAENEEVVKKEEPIYAEISERQPSPDDSKLKETLDSSSIEDLKSISQKDTLIEAPADIFGNPVDDDW